MELLLSGDNSVHFALGNDGLVNGTTLAVAFLVDKETLLEKGESSSQIPSECRLEDC
jgi:hypothetical protein